MSIIYPGTSRLSPEFVLLGFIYQNPNYGYDLHKRMEVDFENIWHASQSQTYNILKRLEAQGYIIATHVEQEKLPPKQMLHITGAGRQRFEDWLNKPTKPSVHAIRVEFISRLYFMQLFKPQEVQPMIHTQVDVVVDGILQQEENLRLIPETQPFNRLALELRIQLLHSVISWLKECGAAFDQGQFSGEHHA